MPHAIELFVAECVAEIEAAFAGCDDACDVCNFCEEDASDV